MAKTTIEVPDNEDARCPHKNTYRGRDISGGPDGRCHDCGYSW